jgi:hypothetical protein
MRPVPSASDTSRSARTADIQDANVWFCRGPQGIEATGQYTEEGMVVLEGSRARVDVVASMASAVKRRQGLIDAGDLVLEGGSYRFRHDVLFRSPSGASNVVLGRNSNGWDEWRDSTGRTLNESKRQRAIAAEGEP